MCLAHENVLQSQTSSKVVSTSEGSTYSSSHQYSSYNVNYLTAAARLHLLRGEYKEAKETLTWAVKEDVLVR